MAIGAGKLQSGRKRFCRWRDGLPALSLSKGLARPAGEDARRSISFSDSLGDLGGEFC